MLHRFLLAALVGAMLTVSSVAKAGEPPLAAPRTSKVAWRPEWQRFTWWEGALTVGATVGVYFADKIPDPSTALWKFEVPIIDPGGRYLLRGRSLNVQEGFARYSDVGFRMMAFLPYVMDVGVASLAIHRNPDVAAQLFLIDIQALTLSGATQLLISKGVARERPYVQDCVDGKTFAKECAPNHINKSFFSGHAAGAFASAGLVCLHHQNLPLFGGGPIEAWTCTWAVGVATLTSVARLIHDVHYVTDVIFGAGVGWFYGYVMPRLLHFRNGKLVTSSDNGWLQKLGRFTPAFTPTNDGEGGVISISGAL